MEYTFENSSLFLYYARLFYETMCKQLYQMFILVYMQKYALNAFHNRAIRKKVHSSSCILGYLLIVT